MATPIVSADPGNPAAEIDMPTGSSPVAGQLSPDDDRGRSSRSQTQKVKPQPLQNSRQTAGKQPIADSSEFGQSPPRPSRDIIAAATGGGRRSTSPFGTRSPSRGAIGRASPHRLSPATSMIFERDVQEAASLNSDLSPAIPTHITTEDHIPPVLEASSLAITDNYDPDEVEVVMHSQHQPAAVVIAHETQNLSASVSRTELANMAAIPGHHATSEAGMSSPISLPGGMSSSHHGGLSSSPTFPPGLSHSDSQEDREMAGSTMGARDPGDPRRLSFISFADVVQAEHLEHAHQSTADLHSHGPGSLPNRSPSPSRSPVAPSSPLAPSGLGLRNAAADRPGDSSPIRGTAGSFMSGVGTAPHSEITVQTMRETLQKTGSNDVGIGSFGSHASSEDVSQTAAH